MGKDYWSLVSSPGIISSLIPCVIPILQRLAIAKLKIRTAMQSAWGKQLDIRILIEGKKEVVQVRSYVYFKSIVRINGRLWEHSRKDLIRIHHGKQHFSIGKDALLVLAVLKTDRGVEGRRHEKKRAGVAASIEQSHIKSTCKRAVELGIARTTMRDHMKKDRKVSDNSVIIKDERNKTPTKQEHHILYPHVHFEDEDRRVERFSVSNNSIASTQSNGLPHETTIQFSATPRNKNTYVYAKETAYDSSW
ncbi:hypothetical protein C0J52_21928 [Blattella germanica]|nr:hypothetical protein C0J52_21928 [Blattella germanica]